MAHYRIKQNDIVSYLRVPVTEVMRQKVCTDLEKYCGLDTEGMRLIVDRLRFL